MNSLSRDRDEELVLKLLPEDLRRLLMLNCMMIDWTYVVLVEVLLG